MGNFWTIFEIKICLRARKVILPGLSRNGLPGLFTMPLIIMTEVLRSLFVLKFIVSPCVFCCCCCFVFFVIYWAPWSKQLRYQFKHWSKRINSAVWPGTLFRRHWDKSAWHSLRREVLFFFAKRRATVLPIYFHFLWATDVTNIIGMRTNWWTNY